MKDLFSKFMAMPIPGKAMLGMALSGGVFGALWLLGDPFRKFAPYVGVVMIVMTFVLAAFAMLMQGRSKKKAKEVEEGLAENASSSPAGVSKVEDRAALDRLRGQFEKGITTFKDYGKDLYSMPWYVVVGEPGSGKTEAIRHSGIGFPPGLQDQLQGTGGTVNMNWWFTDKAVLLDTAGRLMFEDVAPGENNEWREFLRLLRSSRPNCPINGMLLIIPADTLITDTPDEIQHKAGKIAQQFDQIQRSLGVRFPVFVLITKADLINGFREFFDDITDPVLAAQMVGWSNPADLDDPFTPERVEEHLETIRSRLLERRFALLQDPVHTADAKGRRIDQVDALFKFPEALTEIGPRLRRYLEMIFVSGEWSQKPLFLRGIYFTSSMREGEALDAALAETLGVSVESLSGASMKIERSYFLRDVFLDKVFKESRLVTRAANAGQVKRKRSLVMIGAGLAAALIIGATTFVSYSQTQRQIGDPHELWQNVWRWTRAKALDSRDWREVEARDVVPRQDMIDKSQAVLWVEPDRVTYNGDLEQSLEFDDDGSFNEDLMLSVGGVNLTAVDVFANARLFYERSSGAGGMYALLSAFPIGGGDVFRQQLPTQQLMFERLAFRPAAAGARRWLLGRDDGFEDSLDWDSESSAARRSLAAMLSLELDHATGGGAPGVAMNADAFAAMVSLSVGGGARDGEGSGDSMAGLPELAEYFGWLYGEENLSRGASWPPDGAVVEVGTEASLAAIERGVERFTEAVSSPTAEGTLFGQLKAFDLAAGRFDAAESDLRQLAGALERAETVPDYEEAKRQWSAGYDALLTEARALDAAFQAIGDEFDSGGLRSGVQGRARDSVVTTATARYEELLAVFEENDAAGKLDEEDPSHAVLIRCNSTLRNEQNNLVKNIGERVEAIVASINSGFPRFAAGSANGGQAAYQRRVAIYAVAKEAIDGDAAPIRGDGVDGRLAWITVQIDGDGDEPGARGRAGSLVPVAERGAPDPERPAAVRPAADSAGRVLDAVARFMKHRVVGDAIGELTGYASAFERAELPAFKRVPFSTLEELSEDRENGRFGVGVNEGLIRQFAAVKLLLDGGGGASDVLDPGALNERLGTVKEAFDRHVGEYARFWSRTVLEHLVPASPASRPSWGDFQAYFPEMDREIEDAADRIRAALALLDGYTATDEVAAARIEEALEVRGLADAEHVSIESDDDEAEKIADTQRAWRSLVEDAEEARAAVIESIELETFFSTYMPLDPPTERIDLGPIAEYYSWVALLGLEVLVDEAGSSGEANVNRAVGMAQRFPVTLDATGAGLSRQELVSLRDLLDEIPLDEASAAVPDAGAVQRSRFPEIDRRLRALTGENVLSADGGRVRRLLRAAEPVVDALVDAGEFGVTIAFFGVNDPVNMQADPSRQRMRQVLVIADGVQLLEPGMVQGEFRKCEVREVVGAFRFDCPITSGLRFKFIESANDIDRPWEAALSGFEPLRALAADDVNFGGADVWPLVIEVTRGGAESMRPRIGFVFEEGGFVGLRDGWPRRNDW